MNYVISLDQADSELLDWLNKTPPVFLVDLLRSIYSVARCNTFDETEVSQASTLLKRLVTDSGLSLSSDAVALHVLRERERLTAQHAETVHQMQQNNGDLSRKLEAATCQLAEITRNIDTEILSKTTQVVTRAERECLEVRTELETEKARFQTEVLAERLELQKSHAAQIASLYERLQSNTHPLVSQITALVECHVGSLKGNVGQGLSSLREVLSLLEQTLLSPLAKIEDYVDRFSTKDSSVKGRVMEDKLFVLLSSALPQYEVQLCRDTAHTMDIRLTAATGQKILIDVKNYSHNVGSREIRKFHQDVVTNNCSGILLSVNTGIAAKAHMQLDVIANHHPVVYLHSVGGDMDVVVAAVNVLNSVDVYIAHNQGEVTFDPAALHKMTETVKRLHRTSTDLKENNDKQRRLICELETDSLLTALTGACTQSNKVRERSVASSESRETSASDFPALSDTAVNISLDTDKLETDCLAFCEQAVERGKARTDYVTLEDARTRWSELFEAKKIRSAAPTAADLKMMLQLLLNTDCLKKKQINGKVVHGVFGGFVLK